MRVFNEAFQEALDNPAREFRFTAEVQFDAGVLVYFPSHSDAGRPVGATVVDDSLASISAFSQRLDNRNARAEIGALTLEVGDFAGASRAALNTRYEAGKSPRRKRVVVYAGFKGLDWVDYEPIDTFYIDNLVNTGSGWKFSCTDLQKEARTKIFVPDESTLSESVSASASEIPLTIASTSGVFETVEHDSFYSDRPGETVGYIRIDDEIIAHTGFVGTSLQVATNGRGVFNTKATAHESDSSKSEDKRKKVEEFIYLEGRTPDILHQILTGESIDGNRTIPDNWHSGISTSDVETATFANIGEDLYSATGGRKSRAIGEKDVDAKQFAEEQIMRWSGLYQVISSAGALRLRRYQPILSTASYVERLSNKNLVDVSDLKYVGDDLVNVINILWGYDWLDEDTTRTTSLIDADSINLHGEVAQETYKFRTVHTGVHTDADLRTWFDAFRDLYSNPPYELSVTGDATLIRLEVGDPVRVDTHMLGDFVSDTDLDRTFEIRQRRIDYEKGRVRLNLIGSSRPAGQILPPDGSGSVGELNSSWYTGSGTDLDSLSQVSSGVVTSDVTLTGNADANNSAAVYYHDGDLEIDSGVTVTITENVQLRIRGFLTINGSIDGVGQGISAANGNHAVSEYAGLGTPGYIGQTLAGRSLQVAANSGNPDIHRVQEFNSWWSSGNLVNTVSAPVGSDGGSTLGLDGAPFQQTRSSVPIFSLTNPAGSLGGLPGDLRGTSGSAGMPVWRVSPTPSQRVADGGDGGDGGAGLIIVAQGIAFGASGGIDTSGAPGQLGQSVNISADSPSAGPAGTYYAGSGAGGFPGGVLVVVDGDFTPPSLSSRHTANRGDSPAPPATPYSNLPFAVGIDPDSETAWTASTFGGAGAGYDQLDMGESAHRIQFAPLQDAPEQDQQAITVRTLATPTGLTLANGPAIWHEDGTISEYILATWSPLNDEAVTHYQLRAKRSTDNDYHSVGFAPADEADEGLLIPADFGVQYDAQIRAIGNGVQESAWSSVQNHTVTSEVGAPSDVTGFKVSQNGALVNFFWKLISDTNRDGYNVRYGPSGVSWEDATPLLEEGKGTRVTSAYVPNGTWDFLIKAINLQKKLSDSAARDTLTVDGLLDIINQTEHSPEWSGTLTGYRHTYTDKLVPLSQNIGFSVDMWDEVVRNPVATSSYETAEIDAGVEAKTRISATIDSTLAMNTTGVANPALEVDYRGEGGSYDGFEDWDVAEVIMRYAKFKLVNDNSDGIAIIHGFNTVLDAQEREEKDTSVTVAPGGTAITFDTEYRQVPFIEVGTIGSGGNIPESANDATTGFTFHIYDSSGSSVGGTGKWKAVGV